MLLGITQTVYTNWTYLNSEDCILLHYRIVEFANPYEGPLRGSIIRSLKSEVPTDLSYIPVISRYQPKRCKSYEFSEERWYMLNVSQDSFYESYSIEYYKKSVEVKVNTSKDFGYYYLYACALVFYSMETGCNYNISIRIDCHNNVHNEHNLLDYDKLKETHYLLKGDEQTANLHYPFIFFTNMIEAINSHVLLCTKNKNNVIMNNSFFSQRLLPILNIQAYSVTLILENIE
jgi:hypothetical protein